MPLKKPFILVVDDDRVTCDLLCEVFEGEGLNAEFALSGEAALALLESGKDLPDLIISDIRMKTGLDGLGLLEQMQLKFPQIPIALMTAFGSSGTAIRAIKGGAFDYISKPFEIDELVIVVRRALADKTAEPENLIEIKESENDDEPISETTIIGRSPSMLEIFKMIARISDSAAAILITGESGTGKELVAKSIHRNGSRRDAPFIGVNCGALTETLIESELFGHVKGAFTGATSGTRGIFEQAADGTVFLDEIGETSPALQVKLLRVLQEREFVPVGGENPVKMSARVIAAGNADLDELSRNGNFRRDLFYRLNVINIHLPPLRNRREDIPLLAKYFLKKHTPEGVSTLVLEKPAEDWLAAQDWLGNIRELENAVERGVTLNQNGRITLADLGAEIKRETIHKNGAASRDYAMNNLEKIFSDFPDLKEIEWRYAQMVLEAVDGNQTRAAEILGINRKTLYRLTLRKSPQT